MTEAGDDAWTAAPHDSSILSQELDTVPREAGCERTEKVQEAEVVWDNLPRGQCCA